MSRAARRGFTLIELMIVVAIVGILAVLGIVGYRALILSAHTSEATHMVQSIRVAEETYHAEAQTYVSTLAGAVYPGSGLYPADPPGAFKTNWTTPTPSGTCAGAAGIAACFGLLPVHADGPVAYGYGTFTGIAGAAPGSFTLPITTLAGPAASTTDWYWVCGVGNPDGNANNVTWSYVVGNSFTNDLFVQDQ